MKTLDNQAVAELLMVLVQFPFAFSHLEENEADELETRGLFSLDEFQVTAAGRDWLELNREAICAA